MRYQIKIVKLILLFELFSSTTFVFSQGEFNNWIFGYHVGMNFNSGTPVLIPNSYILGTYGATVSVSDSLGNLLFFGIPNAVCNRNFVVMPNGFISTGTNDENPEPQFNLAVQSLTDDSTYLVFSGSTEYYPVAYGPGLQYSLLNMRLDGGLGDIDVTHKDMPLPNGQYAVGALTGARHKNNKYTWIVTRLFNNSGADQYASYLIDSTGLVPLPVYSPSNVPVTWGPAHENQVAEIKISQDGKKLACIYGSNSFPEHRSVIEYCNFDFSTGHITPLFTFNLPDTISIWNRPSSMEFSPDSKLFYVSSWWDSPVYRSYYYQYNATQTDSVSFTQSCVPLGLTNNMSAIQLAPDGKIYGTSRNLFTVNKLTCIEHPNIQGIGCNFQDSAFTLLPGTHGDVGLPHFVQRYYVYLHNSSQCQGGVGFSSTVWPPADSVHWDFGDLASGGNNVSNLPSPVHTYSTPGSYQVMLIVRHNDNRMDTGWLAVTILDSPHPALGQDRSICTGDSVMLDAGSWINSSYAWDNLTAGQYNISTSQHYWAKAAGNYRVTVTNSNGCIGMDTVMVSFSPPPDITTNPLFKFICSGESTNISLTSNPPGANFHWTASLISGTVTGFIPDSGTVINQVLINSLLTPGTITYHITPKVGSCTGNTVDFQVTVNPGVPVTISISASQNNVCAGTMVTFTATPGNQGAIPVYQWKVNGINQPGNSTTFSYTPANNDVITCVLTSSNTVCTSNNPATSNAITMTVNLNLPVSITLTSAPATICTGSPITFTAHPTNEGLSPVYQWIVNGVNIGINSPNYSYIPINGDLVSCTLTSSETCTTNNPASSIQYPVSVNPLLPVSITISTPTNPFCLGSSVTFTSAPSNGGIPLYQWKVNGLNAGINSSTFTYTPAGGDVVTCIMNSTLTCTTGNPATSNSITMIVNTGLPAGVTISATPNPFCPGGSVTCNAAPTNGGPLPGYQWKVNGANVGINSNTYTYNPANGDSVRCIMTSNLACVTGSPCSSPKIIMNGNLAPVVTFTACFDTITTLNAKPIKLKGGIPLGGIYSGPGVNSITGYFNPALAGVGTKTITYSYTNSMLCSAAKSISIINFPLSIFNCGNPLTDIRDSKTYQTVQIGSQCWLSTNLNFGTILSSSQDQRDNCIAEKYCYNDNPVNCTNHGGLYQWDELMLFDASPAAQGFCPPGWHIPSENDWNILFSSYISNAFAGSPLKYSGFSGFNALLSGARHMNRGWDLFGFATFFWSSTPRSDSKAWAHGMNEVDPSVSLYPASRINAYSVRCLRD
jgi:uncharacterized protein (TIGR02145 family)